MQCLFAQSMMGVIQGILFIEKSNIILEKI
jgi:hypothetical protein